MIWHIFKKDWTLLWRFAAGVGALYFALMVALLRIGRFGGTPLAGRGFSPWGEDLTLFTATSMFPLLCLLASAFLITAIVQQEAIPGVRQDWLVRPIRRRDLFLAKMLGVLLMVIGPIFAADLLGALFNGFAVWPAISAALGHSLWLWIIPFLPVFVLATLTRNFMEMIVGGIALVGVWYVMGPLWFGPVFLLNRGSVEWMDQLIRFVVVLIGAATLLTLQYRWRRTLAARLLTAAVLLIYVFVPGVRSQTAFALEQRLSPNPGAGNVIRLSFIPDRTEQEDRPVGPASNANRSDAWVLLPIRATGLPDDAILNADSSIVRLITPDGQALTLGYQMGFQIWREPARGGPNVHVIEQAGNGEKPITYVIRIPRSVYARWADQPLRVEIDYSLTLLRVVDTQTLPATGGDGRTRGLGWCGTKISEASGEVLFGCIQAGSDPRCVSIVLEHTPSGARGLPDTFCRPDYSPFRRGYNSDALSRFTERLSFGSVSGVDLSPIKETMLPESQVKARLYEPQDHFSRQLIIPEVRLKDWASTE
jgi:hypothetical protein